MYTSTGTHIIETAWMAAVFQREMKAMNPSGDACPLLDRTLDAPVPSPGMEVAKERFVHCYTLPSGRTFEL
jgi:hypothetical protein